MFTLFTVILLLNALDVWSTYNIIIHGKGKEGNKLMAAIMLKIGILPGLMVSKVIVLPALYYVATQTGFATLYSVAVMCIVALFYAWVCWNNWKILYGK